MAENSAVGHGNTQCDSGTMASPSDEGEYEGQLRDSMERVQRALEQSGLAVKTQQRYTAALGDILRSLTPAAFARHHANTKEFKFYATHWELTAAFLDKYPEAVGQVKGVLKGAFDRDATLHLNGAGMLFGEPATLQQFYAHEVTHSIDGNRNEISGSHAWLGAWEAEKELFSANGQKKPSEGFAEFGQMLLSSGLTRTQMRQAWPKCLTVWEDHGL